MRHVSGNSPIRPASARGRGGRRGLTLIEVLALTALSVVALALAMPSIHAAQLRARRAMCVNNLRQMGLALNNYHSAIGCFPMSKVAGGLGRGVGHSNFALVLPYMELSPVYNAYNFGVENWHASNFTVDRTQINTFLCPDNPGSLDLVAAADVLTPEGKPAYPGSKARFARSHYGANWGGGHAGWGDDFVKADGTYRGTMMTVVDPTAPKGKSRIIGMRDILDGSSWTLLLAEKHDSYGWAVGGWGGSEFDVAESPAYRGTDAKAQRVYSGSTHLGGQNILFCDGSTRFLADAIDRKIWYALITRDGAEIIRDDDLKAAPR